MVKWKNLSGDKDNQNVVNPMVMSYDLEVYSQDHNKMPEARKPKDVIFQISCVFARNGEKEDKHKKYLLSLGEPDPSTVGEDVIVKAFENEYNLIEGFVDLIHEKQPNIILGYNIFGFDIGYMIERSKFRSIYDKLQSQGFHRYNKAPEKTIKWSSSAYGTQEFLFLDAEGRLYVDLLPLVKRDFKMDSYNLKSISTYFLGETKDPLTPKGIFKCYQIGMKGGEKGARALGIVGKYCVQDSALVLKLFGKLQTWFGLTEQAKICNVPIFTLYTQGQQIKVFSQMYKKCMNEGFVVEKNGYVSDKEEHYQGALVFEPVPGVYSYVVSFDFSSLYPSIMIAYNIDYSTLVPFDDESIPEKDCHVVEWEEHQGCEHDDTPRKVKPKYILCGRKKFKYLKNHKGVLPSLVEGLLAARKKTRLEQEQIKERLESDTSLSEDERKNLEILYNVLEQRQLGYKVSANSSYGATGAQKGYLTCLPLAMSITAMGRQSITKVFDVIRGEYQANIILSDTDSVYCTFDHIKTTQELWEYCLKVSKEISSLFPKPMKLDFEGKIYWRLLTLTKKRYMSLKCDKDGIVSKKMDKKGVLLSRRDNSNFVRTVYQDIILKIFYQEDAEEILYTLINHLNRLCSRGFDSKDFIITKSVGDPGQGAKSVIPIKDSKGKAQLGSYKVPLLVAEEGKKRTQQLALKNASNDEEYYLRCLPAQVQLACKIRARGGLLGIGTRLPFLILDKGDAKAKLYDKVEDFDYYRENSSVLNIDFMYYLKALVNCLDQVFECTLKDKALDFTKNQYKLRLQKMKVMEQIKRIFSPRLIFDEE